MSVFRIVTRELGYPIYASMALMEFGSPFSERRPDATEFVDGEDDPETKLKWFRALAKNRGYDATQVVIERDGQ